MSERRILYEEKAKCPCKLPCGAVPCELYGACPCETEKEEKEEINWTYKPKWPFYSATSSGDYLQYDVTGSE